ncbi:MAG: methyltransferase [Synergistaceae bacterium]|nr:methyltransferase [Synergistaceae bacterium]
MSNKREDFLNGILKIEQPDESMGLRVNLDTVLLSYFSEPRKNERILELGCAHGAISLILAYRGFNVVGLDIQRLLIEMAKRNALYNGLEAKTEFIAGDLREYKKLWPAQSFDRIVVNPPYDVPENSRVSPSSPVAVALQGTECALEDIVLASKYLLKNKGHLEMVIRANRIGELLALLDEHNISPKEMRPVYSKPNMDAFIVLVRAMRAAGPSVRVLPPFFVKDENGDDTLELLSAYKAGKY